MGQPLDRAFDILKDVIGDMDLKGMAEREWDDTPESATKWRKLGRFRIGTKDRAVMMRYRNNWLLANFVWYRTIAENDVESLDTTALGYADVYHSIGTARWSMILGFVLNCYATAASMWGHFNWWHFGATLGVNLLLTVVFFRVLSAARYDTLSALLQFKHDLITYFHRFPRKTGDPNEE